MFVAPEEISTSEIDSIADESSSARFDRYGREVAIAARSIAKIFALTIQTLLKPPASEIHGGNHQSLLEYEFIFR